MDKIYQNILSSTSDSLGNISNHISPNCIKDFFTTNDRILKIPSYQRPYSWEKENLLDLLIDIKKCWEGENNSWFIGTVFSTRESVKNNPFQLLDGQQRLTSLQIIFWNLRYIGYSLTNNLDWDEVDESEFPDLYNNFYDVFESLRNVIYNASGENRFLVQYELIDIWEEFMQKIKNPRKIEDIDTYLNKDFREKLLLKSQEGYPSAKRLLELNMHTQQYLKDLFSDNNGIVNVYKFTNYTKTLLHKLWLIEIELISDKDSLKIFEALNNRGKSLTLTDKLRFKCLINFNGNIQVIRDYWKEIYLKLDALQLKGYVSDEDTFFKYYLNITSKKDLTRIRDIISHFEESYLESDNEIIIFCENALKILTHNLELDRFNNEDFIIEGIDSRDFEKAAAMYSVFRKVLFASDNAKFLYYRHIIDTDLNLGYAVLNGMASIARIVLHNEIFKALKSNKVRIEYQKIIKKIIESKKSGKNIEKSLITNAYNQNYINEEYSINEIVENVLIQNDNSKTIFIIYLICFRREYTSIINQVQKVANSKTHCEHFMPESWRKNWPNARYKYEDVMSYINAKNIEIHNHIESNIKNGILLSETESKHPDKSLGQWLGNKWVLHSIKNITLSNKSFADKKIEMNNNQYLALPSENTQSLGLGSFEKFDYTDIIDRSILMSEILIEISNSNDWNMSI